MAMTTKEFGERMLKISKDRDEESSRGDAENLMCDVLKDLGYQEGIGYFEAMGWYS